jgi:hypothetical protein
MTHNTKVQISNFISTAIIVCILLSARHSTDKAQRLHLYAIAGAVAVGYFSALFLWLRRYQRKSRSFSEHL